MDRDSGQQNYLDPFYKVSKSKPWIGIRDSKIIWAHFIKFPSQNRRKGDKSSKKAQNYLDPFYKFSKSKPWTGIRDGKIIWIYFIKFPSLNHGSGFGMAKLFGPVL